MNRQRRGADAAAAPPIAFVAAGVLVILLAMWTAPARATDDRTQSSDVSVLFVLTAEAVTMDGEDVRFAGLEDSVLWFADRPARQAGRMPLQEFLAHWSEGWNDFAKDPPNVAITGLGDDGKEQSFAATLAAPRSEDGALSFRLTPLARAAADPRNLRDVAIFVDFDCVNPYQCGGWRN